MNEDERFEVTNRIEDIFETENDLLYVVTALYDRFKVLYGKAPIEDFDLKYEGASFCHQCGVELDD